MSQHYFNTTLNNRAVQVLMGWDRPLQQVFMVVEASEAATEDEENLYSNLDQPNAESLTLDDFRNALAKLGITVPEAMFVEIEKDRENNVGNRIVNHTPT